MTNRQKLIEMAKIFKDDYHETPKTMRVWGRKFTFNPKGEITKIMDLVHNADGTAKYKVACKE